MCLDHPLLNGVATVSRAVNTCRWLKWSAKKRPEEELLSSHAGVTEVLNVVFGFHFFIYGFKFYIIYIGENALQEMRVT